LVVMVMVMGYDCDGDGDGVVSYEEGEVEGERK
jgi:hypothetical protein